MLAWLLRTKGSSVVPSLTLREIIDGCRGERTEGGEEEEMWVTWLRGEAIRDEFKGASGVWGCLACTWTPSFHWEDESVANNSPSMAVNVCFRLLYGS